MERSGLLVTLPRSRKGARCNLDILLCNEQEHSVNQKDLIINNIKQHLINCKLDPFKAGKCADDAYKHFLNKVGNSKDAYKETCDYAGKLASGLEPKFKYKSPVSKTGKRVKRPQSAFDF